MNAASRVALAALLAAGAGAPPPMTAARAFAAPITSAPLTSAAQDARAVLPPDADGSEARIAALIEAGAHQAAGALLNGGAAAAYGRGDRRSAAALWRRAVAAFDAAGDARAQANALYSLSFADRDDSAAVVAALERALALARSAGAVDLEGQILHRWGDEEFLNGRYASAIDYVEQAVPRLEQAGTPDRLARALTSLGRVYRVHGQYERALAIHRRALALHESTSDRVGIAQSLNALATVLRRVGRMDESLRAAERAVGMLDGDRTGALALTLNTVGSLLAELDRTSEALVAADQALAASPSPRDAALLHTSRAMHLARLGRRDEAAAAAALARSQLDNERRGAVSLGLVTARLAYLRGTADPHAALDESARAVALVDEERRRTLPHDALRAGFDETTQWVYGQHVRLLARAGRPAEALEAAERARARAFADVLAARQIAGADDAAPTASPRSGGITVPATTEAVPLAAIVAQAARLKTTVLAYWVHDDETWAWAVTAAGAVHSARVEVTERRLTTLVGEASSTTPRRRVYRDLYDLLVAPVAAQLPGGANPRLTIIPHGPLFGLSFAALAAPSGRYLVEDYALHYAPSAGVLMGTAVRPPAAASPAAFLVVADPTLARPAATAAALPPLPGALAEGRLVAAAAGPEAALLVRGEATESRVRELAGRHRVLHFATHAVVSNTQPLDSFLALAAAGPAHDDDGRLTAEEVYGLRLDADLVVLSGCSTAAGRITGDGITGLARAFFYAGTPALVAALWELPDTAGRALLPRFYRHWQRHGDKAAALRDAQLAFLRDLRNGKVTVDTPAGRFVVPETPAVWAGLVLIGEP